MATAHVQCCKIQKKLTANPKKSRLISTRMPSERKMWEDAAGGGGGSTVEDDVSKLCVVVVNSFVVVLVVVSVVLSVVVVVVLSVVVVVVVDWSRADVRRLMVVTTFSNGTRGTVAILSCVLADRLLCRS
jgi:Flp pilus assembly protein TadB